MPSKMTFVIGKAFWIIGMKLSCMYFHAVPLLRDYLQVYSSYMYSYIASYMISFTTVVVYKYHFMINVCILLW